MAAGDDESPWRYRRPVNVDVAKAVDGFDENQREFFEERAAIFEHEGSLPRVQAERKALEATRAHFGLPTRQPKR